MTNTEKLTRLTDALAAGRPVHIATATRVTKVTPKVAAGWAQSGKPFFKLSSTGALLMIERGRYVDASYCQILA